MDLTLEEFAARCLWYEHIRLSNFIDDISARKHFRKTLSQVKRGKLGLELGNGWGEIVRRWYKMYQAEPWAW